MLRAKSRLLIGYMFPQCGYVHDTGTGGNYRIVVYQKTCIEPLWESKSDYDIWSELAARLGFREEYTEGKTLEGWIKDAYQDSSLPEYISWEDFNKEGLFYGALP
jgi:trimethylamine-N-oxide reductase (cytochrome c)